MTPDKSKPALLKPVRLPRITEVALREAALAHLARFSATEAGLRRVLGNRIRRFARAAAEVGQESEAIATTVAAAQALAATIAARLVQVGVVDDAAFAQARARRLRRAGRSSRAMLAHLAAKGVDGETARHALAQEHLPDELTAALILCRKRRFGGFAPNAGEDPVEPPQRLKWLASLARAGFTGDIAHRALRMTRREAEAVLETSR